MIDFVQGKIAYTELEYVVVETGGVGYRVFCPNPFAFQDKAEEIRLFTHHHVREDAQLLYGFATREERQLFRKLIDVNGIGPKGALAIMAAGTPTQIAGAIEQEDVKFLTKFPGIGKKTAQRIVLDLKDKMKEFVNGELGSVSDEAFLQQETSRPQDASLSANLAEALEALRALGYHDKEIDKITPSLQQEMEEEGASWTTDQAIKRALQLLVSR